MDSNIQLAKPHSLKEFKKVESKVYENYIKS